MLTEADLSIIDIGNNVLVRLDGLILGSISH
jgi:hypothetical protein